MNSLPFKQISDAVAKLNLMIYQVTHTAKVESEEKESTRKRWRFFFQLKIKNTVVTWLRSQFVKLIQTVSIKNYDVTNHMKQYNNLVLSYLDSPMTLKVSAS